MHCRLLSLRCARATELFQRRGALPVRSLRTQTICSGVIMRKKKVVVVGAGFAGVTAARTLLSESKTPIEVTVLEGSSRIGGRACTKEVTFLLPWKVRHTDTSPICSHHSLPGLLWFRLKDVERWNSGQLGFTELWATLCMNMLFIWVLCPVTRLETLVGLA